MRNGDFFKKSATQTQQPYVVKNLVLSNRLVLWGSYPGEGKSLLGEALLYHVAYHAPYLGMEVSPGNVMFIDSENRWDVLKWRCNRIKAGLEMDGFKKEGEIDFQHYSGFLLDNKATWEPIVREIKVLRPSLILFDHLAMFHTQDEDKAKGMTSVAKQIEELMDIGNCSVLVMHHFNKLDKGTFLQRLRGSVSIYAKCDCACEVRTISRNEGKLEKVGLIFQPRKDITPVPIRVKIEEGEDWIKLKHDGTYHPIEDVRMDNIYHDIYHVFLKFKGEKSVNDVRDTLEGYASDREIRDSLRGLETKNLLSKRMANNGRYMYQVKQTICPWCTCANNEKL